jgi:hypothetical protein
MKKKIFTLICLSFLLSSVVSMVVAQSVGWTGIGTKESWAGGGWPSAPILPNLSDADNGFLYSQCEYTFIVKGHGSDEWTFFTTLEATYRDENDALQRDTLPSYLNIPSGFKVAKNDSLLVTFSIKDLPAKYDSVNVLVYGAKSPANNPLIVTTEIGPGRHFKNYPQVSVAYTPPTVSYPGRADISVLKNSNEYNYYGLLRSFDGVRWDSVYYKDDGEHKIRPLTEAEIDNLLGDVIYFKELNTCSYITVQLTDPELPFPGINRPVTIPGVSGAILTPSTGIHRVAFGADFTFTVRPQGANAGLMPKVSTGRSLPEGDDVSVKNLGNGLYEVTIKKVTEALNLSIEFVPDATAAVETSSVWSAGGQVYVTAATATSAKVYGATGALVKQIALSAGETTGIAVPTGFYIVTLNNKAYKVIVK